MARTYRCQDCPPSAAEHAAGARGPLPDRCPAHRARREAQQARRRRSGLRVVDDSPPPASAPPPPAPPAAPGPPAAGTTAAALERTLAELATTHPAEHVLTAAARRLAALIDDPTTVALDGPRAVPALTKELRAILDALVDHEEADHDDLFGAGSPTPVVVPAQA